jgi:hypothetical protein
MMFEIDPPARQFPALGLFSRDPAGNADDGRIFGHVFDYDRVRADTCACAHGHGAKDLSASSRQHPIAKRGVALSFAPACAAKRDAVITGDIVSHDRGFADHDARSVIDEEAPANLSARMNIHIGEEAREPGDEPRRRFRACLPEPVRDAMPDHGVDAGIQQKAFQAAACGRIAELNARDVFLD